MRVEFFAIQLFGVAVALVGIICMAALPLPDYRWYNRVFVVFFMWPLSSLTVIVEELVLLLAKHAVDPLFFSIVSLMFGVPFLVILYRGIDELFTLYPAVKDGTPPAARRLLTHGIRLWPAGIVIQLIPSVLTLAGALMR